MTSILPFLCIKKGLLVIVKHFEYRGYHRVVGLGSFISLVVEVIELLEAQSGPLVWKTGQGGMFAVFFRVVDALPPSVTFILLRSYRLQTPTRLFGDSVYLLRQLVDVGYVNAAVVMQHLEEDAHVFFVLVAVFSH